MKVHSSLHGASSLGVPPWTDTSISQPRDAEKATNCSILRPQQEKTKCLEMPQGSLKPGTAKVVLDTYGNWGMWHYLSLGRS
jgi:hypothetical protein